MPWVCLSGESHVARKRITLGHIRVCNKDISGTYTECHGCVCQVNPTSLENVEFKWAKELQHHMQNSPVMSLLLSLLL